MKRAARICELLWIIFITCQKDCIHTPSGIEPEFQKSNPDTACSSNQSSSISASGFKFRKG